MLATARLFLIPATPDLLDAAASQDWPTLAARLGGVDLAAGWTHFPEALHWVREYLQEHPDEAGWWTYFIVHRTDVRLIGTGGFKGLPGPDGVVEIGYEIAPAYQRQGLATEAAGALVAHARAQSGVEAISAHTLAEENASVRVLRKLGFVLLQEKIDLTDGHLWEWRL